jgi:hypothetical protein
MVESSHFLALLRDRTTRAVLAVVRQLSGSACSSYRELRFDDVTDQTLRPFDEGQMVGEAALEQHTHAMVTGRSAAATSVTYSALRACFK